MSNSHLISRFTPSRTRSELLRQMFVQRHALLTDTQERIRESVLTGNKHHLLFVGPRGFGKTHLVSMLFDWADRAADLRDRVRIAWLNEDDSTTSWLTLLLRIHAALEKKYPGEFPAASRERLHGQTPEHAAEKLCQLLLHQLTPRTAAATTQQRATKRQPDKKLKPPAPRTLLVFVENLDAVFEGLGLEGQKRLRAFLQEHPQTSLVATSPQLFSGVQSRNAPFFGFFQIEHLQPLTVKEATTLLRNIAHAQHDRELVAFLSTPEGRSRIQAIHHLAGGNHRVYVVLSQFLTKKRLDELVPAFERLLDELTPYYQERLRWLSAQQRELVEALCRAGRLLPVKELAAKLFMSPQTASGQLQKLTALGYVRSDTRGRESFYELAEPLLRMTVEIKDNQRTLIGQTVEFLRLWFRPSKPSDRLAGKSRTASDTLGTIKLIVQTGWDVSAWRKLVRQLVERSAKANTLSQLGDSLVRSLGLLQDSPLSRDALGQWRDVWREVSQPRNGEPLDSLTIPFRLFDVGIRFLQTHDTRVLLDLPSEQRVLLQEVLPAAVR